MNAFIHETGDRAIIALDPGVAPYVSIYEPESRLTIKLRYSVAFPWARLRPPMPLAIESRRNGLVNAKSAWAIEVGVKDTDRLVRELQRYEARNLTRDRFLRDTGFEIDIALARYEWPNNEGHVVRAGNCLILKGLRLPW